MTSRRSMWSFGFAVVVVLAGCGAPQATYETATGDAAAPAVAAMPTAPRSSRDFYAANKSAMAAGSMMTKTYKDPGGGADQSRIEVVEVMGGGEAADPKPPVAARKILYTADVDLVVEDFPNLETAILKLVREGGGYLADTDISGSAGSNRTARWKIRIPIEKFDAFLESAAKLGELTRRQVHSQDVTEEFYDLEARIKNKKVEETRLLKHLQDSTGKLDEILAAERELSRVREEVERQEGRLRLLADLAALTTITISAQERTDYVPATAPDFATRASRQLADSTKGLVEAAQGVAIWAIGILPWLPLYLVLGLIAFVGLRRLWRRAVAYFHRPRPAAS